MIAGRKRASVSVWFRGRLAGRRLVSCLALEPVRVSAWFKIPPKKIRLAARRNECAPTIVPLVRQAERLQEAVRDSCAEKQPNHNQSRDQRHPHLMKSQHFRYFRNPNCNNSLPEMRVIPGLMIDTVAFRYHVGVIERKETPMTRTAKTRTGQKVILNETRKVQGGYEGYVLNSKGHAVEIFIPTRDDEPTNADRWFQKYGRVEREK
jgi:hypothetical protein